MIETATVATTIQKTIMLKVGGCLVIEQYLPNPGTAWACGLVGLWAWGRAAKQAERCQKKRSKGPTQCLATVAFVHAAQRGGVFVFFFFFFSFSFLFFFFFSQPRSYHATSKSGKRASRVESRETILMSESDLDITTTTIHRFCCQK